MEKSKNICCECGLLLHEGRPCVAYTQQIIWKYGGQEVSIVGEWSRWQKITLMRRIEENPEYEKIGIFFVATVALHPGVYQYKFLVDGRWMHDYNDNWVLNSYGSINNLIEVFPASHETPTEHDSEDNEMHQFPRHQGEALTTVKISTRINGSSVFIKGSWDGWNNKIQMKSKMKHPYEYLEYVAYLKLSPGKYEYKFVVDDSWKHDPAKMTIDDGHGGLNNAIMVTNKRLDKPSNLDKDLSEEGGVFKTKWRTVEIDELNFAAIQGHTMNFVADDIYIFGGFYHGKFCDTLYCLRIDDLEVRGIDTKGRAPEARAFHSSISFGVNIIIHGGYNEKRYFNDYHVFNTTSLTWYRIDTQGEIPSLREKATLTKVTQDLLVHFGGYSYGNETIKESNFNDLHILNLATMNWKNLEIQGEAPKPRSAHSANSYKSNLYVFGGLLRTNSKADHIYDDLYKISFDSSQNLKWVKVETKGIKPAARYAHTSVTINKFLIIYGGRNAENAILGDLMILNLKTNEWIKPVVEGAYPGARCAHAATSVYNSEMIIFGGNKDTVKGYIECSEPEEKRNLHSEHFLQYSWVQNEAAYPFKKIDRCREKGQGGRIIGVQDVQNSQ